MPSVFNPPSGMYTGNSGSASFQSPYVCSFMDGVQSRFHAMLLNMSCYVNLLASSVQVHINFGRGWTVATNLSADPIVQPSGFVIYTPDSVHGAALIRDYSSRFLNRVKALFQAMVERHCNRTAILVIDMRLGSAHHFNSTLRVNPITSPSPFLPPRPPSPPPGQDEAHVDDHGDSSGNDEDEDMDVMSNPDLGMMITDRNDDEHTIGPNIPEALVDDTILFLPVEPGAVAAFFCSFSSYSVTC